MAYQVCFLHFRNGEPTDFATEPVRQVFQNFGITEFGDPVYVNLPDGLSLDCYSGGLENEFAGDFSFEFRGVTGSLFDLIFQLCHAGHLVALAVDTPVLPMVAHASDMTEIAEGITSEHEPILCRDGQDVANVIAPEFGSWQKWAAKRPTSFDLNSQNLADQGPDQELGDL
ncbi:hypothetical protein NA78x_006070 [Anatilimnocola sp. NA78]|uniref:hypothetical protein n=1 Tax=Anatilimnocola sp. NA78 TaxID=3415683 RepID=UPI003CE55136